MRLRFRRIRVATLLIVVAVCAVILGLGVHMYRAWSPVRRYIRESRPGNPRFTRLQAVQGLAYGVPPAEFEAAYPVLLAAAKDPDSLVRAQAAQALQSRRDHYAEVFPILQGLMKDPDPRVREAAIFNLERFVTRGSPEVATLLPDLLAALEDPKPAVRLEACRALYVHGRLQKESRRIVPAMARLVREETGTHRRGALGYLLMIKTIPKDLEPVLRARINDANTFERLQAREGLILLGMPAAERDAMLEAMLVSRDDRERLAAAEWLVQLGKPERALPVLNELASRGDPMMSGRARWSLSLVGPGKDEP